ncbi:MAG: HD domain-containing protein [Betaproteobacteria bacterium]|nr:HD domain-containing protein [Betaproteobacteria bacterium]
MPVQSVQNPKKRRFHLVDDSKTLNERLRNLHDRLVYSVPAVDRIACALYDPGDDMLRTFINSTRGGEAIAGYKFRLADSISLSELAASGDTRVIDNIPAVLAADRQHSAWVLKQGYLSSYTVPMYENGKFTGMIFFNSRQPKAFSAREQIDLCLFSNLINLMIAGEMSALRAISATARVARDFACLRDFETGAHLERMARYARVIARGVAHIYNLSDEFIEQVHLFALLHDIGKIGIPDKILLKPGALDPMERKVMESHVQKGADMVAGILGDFGLQHLPDAAIMRNIVCSHHEFLDGSGYPNHLAGDAVPIEARIVAVADIFDALTSPRPYKPAWSVERACEELILMVFAGKLDHDCVAAIERHATEMAQIGEQYRDAA